MATITIEKQVERDNNDEIRRLLDGPDTIKSDFFSKLAGSRLGRWAEQYADYQLETRYRNAVRL
jgi:hypothetical protein